MVELAKLRVLKAKVAKALKLGMWGPRIPMTSLVAFMGLRGINAGLPGKFIYVEKFLENSIEEWACQMFK